MYELAGDNPFTRAELAAEVSRQSGKTIGYHDLPKDTYDILWMSYELGLSEERLATIFGLNQCDVGAILFRADSVLRTCRYQSSFETAPQKGEAPGENHAESPGIPWPPKIGFDSGTFRTWAARIEVHVCKNLDIVAATLGDMASNMLPKTAQVVFAGAPQQELMQFCLGVYHALGFQRDDLHAITCGGTEQSEPSRQWLQNWGLSWRVTAANQFGRCRLLKVKSPWVVVGPQRPKDASALSLRRQTEAI